MHHDNDNDHDQIRFAITPEGLEALNDHRAVLGKPPVRMPRRRAPAPMPPRLDRRRAHLRVVDR